MADRIMRSLIDHGKVVRGWLGVMIQDVTPELVAALDLPKRTQGALISEVVENSPAQAGGLEQGDVVVRMGDQVVDSSAKLRNLVAIAGADDKVEFEVIRDGRKREIEVKLGEREGETTADASAEDAEAPLGGLSLSSHSRELASRMGLPEDLEGLVVTAVEPGSAAARSGFQPADVILEADRKPVPTPRAFEKIYAQAEEGLVVFVQRRPGRLFIVFEKED
ncbi:MAG: PDZ domain-containing protein [bacterium]|nr:PDZ domain-containing protein [bacterium]